MKADGNVLLREKERMKTKTIEDRGLGTWPNGGTILYRAQSFEYH